MVDKYVIQSYTTSILLKQELDELITLVKPLYLWYSPRATSKKIRERLTRKPSTVVDICFHKERCCGFAVSYDTKVGQFKILFRDGTIIDPNETPKGLYRVLIQHAMNRADPDFLVTRTQNPRVYETLKKLSRNGKIFPDIGGKRPLEDIIEIAQHFCNGKEFNPNTMVVKNVYEGDRFNASYHVSRDLAVKAYFQKILGPKDAFIIVVPVGK